MQKGRFRNVHERYLEHYKLCISVSTLDCLSKYIGVYDEKKHQT